MGILTALRAINVEVVTREAATLRAASYMAGGNDPDRDHSDYHQYRRIGGTKRDLPATTQSDIMERSLLMRKMNPLARRYIDLMRELLTSSDWGVTAEEEAVQEVLTGFWDGPFNQWPQWLGSYSDVIATTGTLVFPLWVNKLDGQVKLGYADPSEISDVFAMPGNPRLLINAKWTPEGKNEGMELPIVRPVTDRKEKDHGLLMAHDPRENKRPAGLLYFRANSLPNETQGLSDLSAAIDYLMGHEEWHAGQTELGMVMNKFVGSIEVEGGPTEIQAAKARYQDIPGFATMVVHNQQEKHDYTASPTMAADAADRDRMHGNFAAASLGIPPHILRGDMGEGNRAIATQANDPAYLKIAARAKFVTHVIRYSCQYALDSAIITGKLPRGIDTTFSVTSPKLLKKDLAVGATVLDTVARLLIAAEQRQWLARSHSRAIFARLLPELGIDDMTLEDIVAKLEEEGPAGGGVSPELQQRLAMLMRERQEVEVPA